ncbi:hypothetical protein C8Q76DRAFT_709326 [Earliella scabrosa]|nr:hypothetical protein C8Q76DRAFT_709326 [Earliella scabrosa]
MLPGRIQRLVPDWRTSAASTPCARGPQGCAAPGAHAVPVLLQVASGKGDVLSLRRVSD